MNIWLYIKYSSIKLKNLFTKILWFAAIWLWSLIIYTVIISWIFWFAICYRFLFCFNLTCDIKHVTTSLWMRLMFLQSHLWFEKNNILTMIFFLSNSLVIRLAHFKCREVSNPKFTIIFLVATKWAILVDYLCYSNCNLSSRININKVIPFMDNYHLSLMENWVFYFEIFRVKSLEPKGIIVLNPCENNLRSIFFFKCSKSIFKFCLKICLKMSFSSSISSGNICLKISCFDYNKSLRFFSLSYSFIEVFHLTKLFTYLNI
jgi:heme/copper-type cytochrome/quinol oxidase subunit 2